MQELTNDEMKMKMIDATDEMTDDYCLTYWAIIYTMRLVHRSSGPQGSLKSVHYHVYSLLLFKPKNENPMGQPPQSKSKLQLFASMFSIPMFLPVFTGVFILVFLGSVFVSDLVSAGVHRRCLFSCSWALCLYLTWSLPVSTGGVYSRVPGLGVCI